jgi:hypothetical protein
MQDLLSKISKITGIIDYSIEPGYWNDEDGELVPVNLIILTHSYDAFNDPFYDELMELYPENNDEYEDDEEYYTSTFIDYEV